VDKIYNGTTNATVTLSDDRRPVTASRQLHQRGLRDKNVGVARP